MNIRTPFFLDLTSRLIYCMHDKFRQYQQHFSPLRSLCMKEKHFSTVITSSLFISSWSLSCFIFANLHIMYIIPTDWNGLSKDWLSLTYICSQDSNIMSKYCHYFLSLNELCYIFWMILWEDHHNASHVLVHNAILHKLSMINWHS